MQAARSSWKVSPKTKIIIIIIIINNLRNLVYIQCKAYLKFSSHMLPVHVLLIFGDQAYLSNIKIYRNELRQ